MSSMATGVFVGRLTRDAELKYSQGGAAICKFSIATDSREKVDGQWTQVPSFWEVVLFGKQGESLAEYLTKGKQIAVSGRLKIDSWEQDGAKRSKVVITAEDVQLLGSKPESDAKHQERPENPATPRQSAKVKDSPRDFADDIPF